MIIKEDQKKRKSGGRSLFFFSWNAAGSGIGMVLSLLPRVGTFSYE